MDIKCILWHLDFKPCSVSLLCAISHTQILWINLFPPLMKMRVLDQKTTSKVTFGLNIPQLWDKKRIKTLPEACEKDWPLSRQKKKKKNKAEAHIYNPESPSIYPKVRFHQDHESCMSCQNFNLILFPCMDTKVNTLLTPKITYCSIISLNSSLFHPVATISFTYSADFLKGTNGFFVNGLHNSLGLHLLLNV